MQSAMMFITFGGAAVASAGATGATRRFAIWRGIVNHPNPIVPQHTRPVAYLGGVGIFIGCAATLAGMVLLRRWGFAAVALPLRIALPSTLFLALGIVDDLVVLSAANKFAWQFVCSTIAVGLGLICPLTGVALVDGLLSVWWILTLVNAFNFTDVCDGLVAGLACITFANVAMLHWADPMLAMLLCGACVGFLFWNRPPARIFLGDAGSHLLGFLAAALTLGAPHGAPPLRAVQAALLVGVPLFELTFLTCVRVRKGLAWWKGSPDHFALRLQSAGLTRAQTGLIAWSLAAAMGASAAALPALAGWQRACLLAAVGLTLAACWRALLRWEVVRPGSSVVEPVGPVQAPVGG